MGNQSVAGRWAEQPSTINMMYNFTGLNYYKFADVYIDQIMQMYTAIFFKSWMRSVWMITWTRWQIRWM